MYRTVGGAGLVDDDVVVPDLLDEGSGPGVRVGHRVVAEPPAVSVIGERRVAEEPGRAVDAGPVAAAQFSVHARTTGRDEDSPHRAVTAMV